MEIKGRIHELSKKDDGVLFRDPFLPNKIIKKSSDPGFKPTKIEWMGFQKVSIHTWSMQFVLRLSILSVITPPYFDSPQSLLNQPFKSLYMPTTISTTTSLWNNLKPFLKSSNWDVATPPYTDILSCQIKILAFD